MLLKGWRSHSCLKRHTATQYNYGATLWSVSCVTLHQFVRDGLPPVFLVGSRADVLVLRGGTVLSGSVDPWCAHPARFALRLP